MAAPGFRHARLAALADRKRPQNTGFHFPGISIMPGRFPAIIICSSIEVTPLLQGVQSTFMTHWPFRRAPSTVEETDRWLVELDGQAVAMIANPADSDMFWYTWDVTPLEGIPIPDDLWDYKNDARRSFRHVVTGERDSRTIPAGRGVLTDGRVLLRGPHRNST